MIEPATASETAPSMLEAYQLGPREQQVAQLVARGLPTREIGAALHLSRTQFGTT
ncbi:LuxR C-terminal-related transcriptional regulator [Actinophytocola xanthii]|uniref:LuxR C-terminal-related transcriptional regulator n=1 Tax=Actinophytocola xanthii TaxID=1912961 RepID=UPI0018EA0034|nr:LuxR C-terminal-related transcriptional regulator [Actinophytocola xanthii]